MEDIEQVGLRGIGRGNLREWSGEKGDEMSKMTKDRDEWKQEAVHDWMHPWSPRLRRK